MPTRSGWHRPPPPGWPDLHHLRSDARCRHRRGAAPRQMPLHVAHSIQALQAGKHVLLRSPRPPALSSAGAGGGGEGPGASMLAENYCYIRPWSIVLGMVRAGLFGELYYGEADQLQERRAPCPPRHRLQLAHCGASDAARPPIHHHNLGSALLGVWRADPGVPARAPPASPEMGPRRRHPRGPAPNGERQADPHPPRLLLRPADEVTYYGLQGTEAAYEGPRFERRPQDLSSRQDAWRRAEPSDY